MLHRPIAPSLSPNTQRDDYLAAFFTLIQPWMWKEGKAIREVEKWFQQYFAVDSVFPFNSGRSAFFAILKAFDIGYGDEVLIQAFTCVAVPDPILWVGAKPVYVDIDESLNIDPRLLEKAITTKTKAIVVQHTFGVPANMELITKITHKYRLLLIEDCCHALGATYKNKKVGTFGDASFFSFGRDKVISSVFGGAAILSAKCKVQSAKLAKIHERLRYPSHFWIFQQLLHPVAFAVILPLYNLWIGKGLLYVLQKLKLLSKPVERCELKGEKPYFYPARYPNALATVLLVQLKKLRQYNNHRRECVQYYFPKLKAAKNVRLMPITEGAIYLRFAIFSDKAKHVLSSAKKKGVLLGNWYHHIIDPAGVSYEKVGYRKGLYPVSEKTASTCVNLPTYPSMRIQEADTVIKLITEVSQ